VGAALLQHLIDRGRAGDRNAVLLEVRASNYDARRLYHRFGFTSLDVRRGYYTDSGEDAVVMSLELNSDRPLGK
jgi:ribosomal-protein-alanine N-acetyltransferase